MVFSGLRFLPMSFRSGGATSPPLGIQVVVSSYTSTANWFMRSTRLQVVQQLTQQILTTSLLGDLTMQQDSEKYIRCWLMTSNFGQFSKAREKFVKRVSNHFALFFDIVQSAALLSNVDIIHSIWQEFEIKSLFLTSQHLTSGLVAKHWNICLMPV